MKGILEPHDKEFEKCDSLCALLNCIACSHAPTNALDSGKYAVREIARRCPWSIRSRSLIAQDESYVQFVYGSLAHTT